MSIILHQGSLILDYSPILSQDSPGVSYIEFSPSFNKIIALLSGILTHDSKMSLYMQIYL
jgi:hypothetical protein